MRVLTYHFHTIKKQQFRFSWSKNSNQFIEEIIFSKLQKSNILIKLNFYCESSFAAWRVLWPSQSIRFVLQYFRKKYKNEKDPPPPSLLKKESKSMQSKNNVLKCNLCTMFFTPTLLTNKLCEKRRLKIFQFVSPVFSKNKVHIFSCYKKTIALFDHIVCLRNDQKLIGCKVFVKESWWDNL